MFYLICLRTVTHLVAWRDVLMAQWAAAGHGRRNSHFARLALDVVCVVALVLHLLAARAQLQTTHQMLWAST